MVVFACWAAALPVEASMSAAIGKTTRGKRIFEATGLLWAGSQPGVLRLVWLVPAELREMRGEVRRLEARTAA